ncbi:peptide chain release factor 2 [Candidatus Saccharibacteria bacterium 32-49-12]|nr:MAG: peptide chain release factor 2 [Candidatus Saccharibacteria bacterium 32-49-12]
MQPLKKRVETLVENLDRAKSALNFFVLEQELADLDNQLNEPEIWNNPEFAQSLAKKASAVRQAVQPWQILTVQLADLVELMELGDDDMIPEFEAQIGAIESEFEIRKTDLLFSGKYDNREAVVRISAGVGGLDAQDFAAILERMYLRWTERHEMKADVIERSTNDEAGIKTSVFEVSGPFAYGKLKSENGVHRLVRLSPFNSDSLRQTSFALVEVLPKIDAPEEVELEPAELKIDVYRAGGHGGQSVNTTDSAVRVTHLPTGLVVAIQNERSQLQNKETALSILRSKLLAMQLEQHASSVADLRAGESANWGSQIRNYVMHPYTLVKDTRTKYEEKDVQKVLDGQIDGFIYSFLEYSQSSNLDS